MTKHYLKKYIENITKTGFCLEFSISQLLKENGWSVINNKYYLDDQQPTVREVDLVAYKAQHIQHYWVYTALIVSCKKSEHNLWALLSKEINNKDPNIDWRPLHLWTNEKALQYMVTQTNFKDDYFREIAAMSTAKAIRVPTCHVFAFQEMNKESGKPQNDRPIFESVISLMKAQAYELNTLQQRRKDPVIYQFNLISVLDTELLRLHFTDDGVEAIPEEDLDYVANYIISKRETSAKVHFIRRDALASILPNYSSLHEANCASFNSLCDRFYADVMMDPKKINVFKDEFLKELLWRVRWELRHESVENRNFSATWLLWKDPPGVLSIEIDVSEDEIRALNENVEVKKSVRKLLTKYYRYKGPFEFAEYDVPF